MLRRGASALFLTVGLGTEWTAEYADDLSEHDGPGPRGWCCRERIAAGFQFDSLVADPVRSIPT
jgi:hypothetical protein